MNKSAILFVIGLSLPLTSCNSKNKNVPNNESQKLSEEYINPFPPEIPDDPISTDEGANPVVSEPIYDEPNDSMDGINADDLSGLYSCVNTCGDNYTSTIRGYFNEAGLHAYYKHYQRNYVCDKTSFYTENITYTMPELDAYLSICNAGFLNKNNNYYSFCTSLSLC